MRGQRKQLQAVTSGTVTHWGQALAQGYSRSRAWDGVGARKEDVCAATHMDSSGRESLTEPAQPKAEGTCLGSGTQGFNFLLSVQFFSSQQAETATG